jgi:hypothetical protein
MRLGWRMERVARLSTKLLSLSHDRDMALMQTRACAEQLTELTEASKKSVGKKRGIKQTEGPESAA